MSSIVCLRIKNNNYDDDSTHYHNTNGIWRSQLRSVHDDYFGIIFKEFPIMENSSANNNNKRVKGKKKLEAIVVHGERLLLKTKHLIFEW